VEGVLMAPSYYPMKTDYKCKYSKCPYGGVVSKDIAVKDGQNYYHPECFKEMNNRKQIIDIFYKYINKDEVGANLRRIVDLIIDSKKATSEFLLYALCYVIHHKIPLHHAAGLYYIINNDDIKQAYKKYKYKQMPKVDISKTEKAKDVKFEVKQDKKNSWDKILE